MFIIKHQWLGYLTELSPNNTTYQKAEAVAFTFDDAAEYLDAPERDHSRHFYMLIRVK